MLQLAVESNEQRIVKRKYCCLFTLCGNKQGLTIPFTNWESLAKIGLRAAFCKEKWKRTVRAKFWTLFKTIRETAVGPTNHGKGKWNASLIRIMLVCWCALPHTDSETQQISSLRRRLYAWRINVLAAEPVTFKSLKVVGLDRISQTASAKSEGVNDCL